MNPELALTTILEKALERDKHRAECNLVPGNIRFWHPVGLKRFLARGQRWIRDLTQKEDVHLIVLRDVDHAE